MASEGPLYRRVVFEPVHPESSTALTNGGLLVYNWDATDQRQWLPNQTYLMLKTQIVFRQTAAPNAAAPVGVMNPATAPKDGVIYNYTGERIFESIEHFVNNVSMADVRTNQGGLLAHAITAMDGEATGNLSARVFTSRAQYDEGCPMDGVNSVAGIAVRIPMGLYQQAFPIPGGAHRLTLNLPAASSLGDLMILQDPAEGYTKEATIQEAILYVAYVTPQVVPQYGPQLKVPYSLEQVRQGRATIADQTTSETFLMPLLTRAVVLSFCDASDRTRRPQPLNLIDWQIRYRGKTVPVYPYTNIWNTTADTTDRSRAYADNATAMLEMGFDAQQAFNYKRWADNPFYIIDTSFENGDADLQLTLTYRHNAANGVSVSASLVAFTDAALIATIENNTFVGVDVRRDTT